MVLFLRDREEAQHCYNALVGEGPDAGLATESTMDFLAAGVAAYHQRRIL